MNQETATTTPQASEPAPEPSLSLTQRIRGWYAEPIHQMEIWIDRAKNLTRSNYELGKEMVRRNKIHDAIFRFRMTLWLDPKQVDAWFNLGCCFVT